MAHYLLSKEREPSASPQTGSVGERTLYHLSLDLSLPQVIRNSNARAAFTDVISHPLTNEEDIIYRQAVLRDFLAHPNLLSSMRTLSKQLDDIRAAWNAYRRSKFGGGAHSGRGRSPIGDARERCSFSASTLGRLLYFIRDMKETLEAYRPESEALRNLLAELRRAASGESFEKLVTVCGEIERHAESGPVNMRVKLNDAGKISSAELIAGDNIKITPPETKQRRRFFSKPAEVYRCESVAPTETETKELIPTPFAELANVTDDIAKEIIERYSDIGRELLFYEAASEYAGFLSVKGVPCTFPRFGGTHSVTELYDIALLTRNEIENVVPHTFRIPDGARGIIIYGENGSGKTSFLRSLSTSQLLAQAGLPVPASSSSLRIYSAFAEQFAEGEKEFAAGNDAGRFEQEVRELAKLVADAPPGALAMLNETFQTTAYAEGAEGLSHILRFFAGRGVFYILVTHMEQLRPIMAGEAHFMRMGENFSPESDDAPEGEDSD